MEVVKVQNRDGGATKGAPRATGEGRSSPGQGYPPRGPHPRGCQHRAIYPQHRGCSYHRSLFRFFFPPLCQQTLFRDCFARLSYSRSQTFLPSFLPFDALLVEHPSSPFIFLGQGCSPVDLRSLDQLSLFFSLLTRSCFEKRHLSLLASRYSDGFSIESRNINRIDIKRQPWLILTIAEKRLRRVGGALVPGL